MKSQQVTKFTLRTLPFLISVAFAGNAFAQQALEEVVVSAQKRTERIQDVPISITAISGQALEDRKIEGASDLQGAVPNLSVVAAPVSGLIAATSIRGLGSGQPSIWADPGVGIYVDGVFVGKNQGSLLDMVDLERVEVLRGPQGTLFGRNTTGGAVNFVTRQPSGEFSGNVGFEVGNYGRRVEKVSIDLPKIDNTLSLTIAARKEKQDGWLANPTSSEKWGNRDREAFKLNAKFDVSQDTKFFYSLDRSDIDETATPMSLTKNTGYNSYYAGGAANAGFFAMVLGPSIAPYVQNGVPTATSSTLPPQQKIKVTGHTFIAENNLNANNAIKYTGSYRTMDYSDQGDYDGTPVNIFSGIRKTNYNTHSHELQLVGSEKGIKYVGGLYYFKDDGRTTQEQIGKFFNFGFGPTKQRQTNFNVATEAKAVYGQVDLPITEKTTFTTGLRYTDETKTGSTDRTVSDTNYGSAYSALVTAGPASKSFQAWTPTFSLSHKLDANNMVFGRLSKGFKAGGFPLEAANTSPATNPLTPFDPERSTSYELGAKGANGAASYSATAFLAKLKSQQISFLVNGTSPIITNAGESTYKGIELEGALRVTNDTKLAASYGYLDAQFDKFLATSITGVANTDAASNLVVAYAPKHTFNVNIDSKLANTEFGKLKGLIEYRYTASYYNYTANKSLAVSNAIPGNLAEDSKMPSLGTINARLSLAEIAVGGPGKAEASLWVKNLTDKQVKQNMMDVSGFYQVGYWSAPRTIGASFNYKW